VGRKKREGQIRRQEHVGRLRAGLVRKKKKKRNRAVRAHPETKGTRARTYADADYKSTTTKRELKKGKGIATMPPEEAEGKEPPVRVERRSKDSNGLQGDLRWVRRRTGRGGGRKDWADVARKKRRACIQAPIP